MERDKAAAAEDWDELRAEDRDADCAAHTVRNPVGLAQLLYDRVGPWGATTVLLAVIDGEGGLRMSGVAGAATRAVSDWSRIPLSCLFPLVRLAPKEQVLWQSDESGERVLTWVTAWNGPAGARIAGRTPAAGGADERFLCVVSVTWPKGEPLEPSVADSARLLVGDVGRALRELAVVALPDEEFAAPWLVAVLDAIPIPAALLFPVRDERQRVVEFRIERCNGRATDVLGRPSDRIAGGGLLTVFPGLAPAGVFDAYVKVLESGVPLEQGPFFYEEPLRGVRFPAVMSVRAQRVAGGLLVSWQFHDEQARMAARIDDAERLVNLGWAEWNLVTGDATWSRGVYEVIGADPVSGPLPLDALSRFVHKDDLSTVTAAMETLRARDEPATFEVRTGNTGETRHVSVTAELVRDSLGNMIAVHGVVQDVTATRRIEAALEASRREAERHRMRMAEDLQLALLPRPSARLPGLRIALRYRPAEDSARVGGDWFEAAPIPDGRVLIAIGDVSGHGLRAAASMARLRNALLGIAHTGADAAKILHCLNLVTLHSEEESVMATAVVGHFCPGERTLVWARGGHPPPVLVRDGRARELDNDGGASLGVVPDPGYRLVTTRLRPGDRVILYTDGLVERRDDHHDRRHALLLDAARRGARGDPGHHLGTLLSTLDTNSEDDTCVIVLHVEG
ncbi:SpoIIE family protein phosphatase [Streptomyces sp. TRM66268-LWL]|uniref:SpoIIE family protein phosphatase n=1 Tax=Streptomyces polyasparticus TaxID=2767826 RepID=A0ABR7SGQ4_9ACTN|nr:SpoIIE family protein phosphatase [Streptomyces polyasparticus]MBC9713920.1 SpoIIE family protein phosphatase [Streptomyces polyasparticus]